jgi:hypothetical protein
MISHLIDANFALLHELQQKQGLRHLEVIALWRWDH